MKACLIALDLHLGIFEPKERFVSDLLRKLSNLVSKMRCMADRAKTNEAYHSNKRVFEYRPNAADRLRRRLFSVFPTVPGVFHQIIRQ